MTSIAKKKKSKVQYSLNDKLFVGFVYAALILVTFLCFYPLYYTVIASFSNAHDVYTGKVSLLPSGFTVKAYTAVFTNDSIWRGYANTIFYTFFGTGMVTAAVCTTYGYTGNYGNGRAYGNTGSYRACRVYSTRRDYRAC